MLWRVVCLIEFDVESGFNFANEDAALTEFT